VLEVLRFDLHSIHAIPGGLWELFVGVWLITNGFNPPATVPEPDKIDIDEIEKMSLSRV